MTIDFKDAYLVNNARFFDVEDLPEVQKLVEGLTEDDKTKLVMLEYKDPYAILAISFVAGTFGIDRIIIGDIALGLIKLMTLGGCGLLSFIDLFLIMKATKKQNLEKIRKLRRF